jgi:putative phosphoribosyl transferase
VGPAGPADRDGRAPGPGRSGGRCRDRVPQHDDAGPARTADAGRRLAPPLADLSGSGAVVLGLARGGMPVAAEVASALDLPLDVLVVRKLGHPGDPELGVGAIAEEGVVIHDERAMALLEVGPGSLAAVEDAERAELARRVARYRGGRPPLDLRRRTAIVVDDGVATGGTALAAIEAVRRRGAAEVVLAVPVGPTRVVAELRAEADRVECLEDLTGLGGVGSAYAAFAQTEDAEVLALLGVPAG